MSIPTPTMVVISSKGQIAIPKEFRVAAGLEAGSKVILECLPDGTLELHPIHYSIHEVFGVGKKIKQRKSKSNEEKDIMDVILEEDESTKRGKSK